MKVSLVSEYIATLSNLISILRIMCLYLERLFVPIIWRLFVYPCTQTNSSLLLKVMWFPPSFTEFASACVQEGPSTIVYKELPRITGAISFYLSSEFLEHFCSFDLNLGRFGPKFHIFQRFADIAINPRLVPSIIPTTLTQDPPMLLLF